MARARAPVPRAALGGRGSAGSFGGADGFDRRAVRWIRFRVILMAVALGLMLVGVSWRAVDLQVVQGERLGQMAEQQALREIVLTPRRGRIADRNGEALALSVDVDSIFVQPSSLLDPPAVVAALSEALELDGEALARRVERGRHFAWAKRRVSPTEAARVRELGLTGVHITKEARRFYPHRELAAHVIGFAGIDGEGLEGLELALDGTLLGTSRSARGLRDARGNRLLPAGDVPVDHLGGGSLTLTLDRTLQYHAEQALAEAVASSEATGPSVVVMDPSTGEVLALATRPTYNPNQPGESPRGARRNRAITDVYEPGSVFKVFTVAAVIEAGLAGPADIVDCGRGRARIGGRTIRDVRPHGELTVTEVMQVSSNVGSARLAARLGKERLVEALSGFGFGARTGIEMPGERGGVLRSARDMSDVCLATVAFGQGISATPLQVATALGALANSGRMMRPWIVREVRDDLGQAVSVGRPELLGSPVSKSTAAAVTAMMEAVVGPDGTGYRAAIPGYRVAGKTGTSQKIDPVIGGYCAERRVASFGGFLPADDPRLVILVVVDEPQGVKYGGVVAAPVFRRIAEEAIRYLGIPPSDLLAASPRAGEVQRLGDGREAGIIIPTLLVPPPEGKTLVPNLSGMDLRGAIRVLAERHLDARPVGAGVVTAQVPRAGAIVAPGETVEVRLAPSG